MEREEETPRVELVHPLIIYRSWILSASVLLAAFVLIFKVLAPTEYRASIVLAPTNSKLSDQFGQLSGLASLAGFNLKGDEGVSDFDSFTYLASSPELARWQIKHRPILELLHERWDESKKEWRPATGLGSILEVLFGPSPPPSPTDVELIYSKHVGILGIPSITSKGDQTGLIELSYQDEDPNVATTMLRYIVDDSNNILRDRAAVRANIQATYLKKQLENVTVQEYRDLLLKLLSQQEQILMLANSNLPYAAAPLSASDFSAERVPKRTLLMTLLAGAIACCFSYFFAILRFNMIRLGHEPDMLDGTGRVPVLPVIRKWLSRWFSRSHRTATHPEPNEQGQFESTS